MSERQRMVSIKLGYPRFLVGPRTETLLTNNLQKGYPTCRKSDSAIPGNHPNPEYLRNNKSSSSSQKKTYSEAHFKQLLEQTWPHLRCTVRFRRHWHVSSLNSKIMNHMFSVASVYNYRPPPQYIIWQPLKYFLVVMYWISFLEMDLARLTSSNPVGAEGEHIWEKINALP